jgi:hypothetical protein
VVDIYVYYLNAPGKAGITPAERVGDKRASDGLLGDFRLRQDG